MGQYQPGTRVCILSGRKIGRYGTITQPPGREWPDENGQIGVALEEVKNRFQPHLNRKAETKLFGPSQFRPAVLPSNPLT